MKEKKETMDYVECTDCGKQLPTAQMTTFQKYQVFSSDWPSGSLRRYWEEVIPGKKRKKPLSDKLPEVKVLCPSCADRLRNEIKQEGTEFFFLGIILLIILGYMIWRIVD